MSCCVLSTRADETKHENLSLRCPRRWGQCSCCWDARCSAWPQPVRASWSVSQASPTTWSRAAA